nr:hypothetical protein [Deltaproteobacteria bacterium]
WNETSLILVPLDILLLVLPLARRRLYARGRVIMLGLVAVLMAFDVLKAPLWSILLWPLIPAAVVGFWPARWSTRGASQQPATAAAPAPDPQRKRA